MRREFQLPPEDEEFLNENVQWETVCNGNERRLIIKNFAIPVGYVVKEADVSLIIESQYPVTPIDMAYFYPSLKLESGRVINALAENQFDGKTWQRWSRHRPPEHPWRPGIDNVSLHLNLVRNWLKKELR